MFGPWWIILVFVCASAGYGLDRLFKATETRESVAKFKRLGDVAGKRKEDIVAVVGKPNGFTQIDADRVMLQWKRRTHRVDMTFRRGICEGIIHESTHLK